MSGSILEEIAEPFREIASIKISDLFKVMCKSFKEIHSEQEIKRELEAQRTCINSLVPQGRVWCDYYKSILAGRCSTNCEGYILRGETD